MISIWISPNWFGQNKNDIDCANLLTPAQLREEQEDNQNNFQCIEKLSESALRRKAAEQTAYRNVV